MSKLFALLDVFRKGHAVADPEKWKKGTIDVNLVTALLAAILVVAHAYGYTFNLNTEEIGFIATALIGVVALANSLLTAATSTRAGLPGLTPSELDSVEFSTAPIPVAGPVAPIAGGGADQHRAQVQPDNAANAQPTRPYDALADPFRDYGA